jgi:hypothetical protein
MALSGDERAEKNVFPAWIRESAGSVDWMEPLWSMRSTALYAPDDEPVGEVTEVCAKWSMSRSYMAKAVEDSPEYGRPLSFTTATSTSKSSRAPE